MFEKKNVLIPNKLFKFIHFGIENPGCMNLRPGLLKEIKGNLLKTLQNYNIKYKELKYNNEETKKASFKMIKEFLSKENIKF